MPDLLVYHNENVKFAGKDFYRLYPNGTNQGAFVDGLPFGELAILKGEEKYYLYGVLSYPKTPRFTVKRQKQDDEIVNDKNLPVCVEIRHKEGKGYQDRIETPTEIEKKIGKDIEEGVIAAHTEPPESADLLAVWSCKFVYDPTNPKSIQEDSGFFHLEFVPEKKELPDLPIDGVFNKSGGGNNNFNGNGKSRGSGYVPQPTAYEKFILEGLPDEWEIKSLAELAVLYDSELSKSINGSPLKELKDKETRSNVVRATVEMSLKLFEERK